MTVLGHIEMAYIGKGLKSLAGVEHSPSRSLFVESQNVTVTNTATIHILNANPSRLWALIVNNDNVQQMVIYFGEAKGYYEVILQPHGSMLINENMRWTGAVSADCVAGSGVVITEECSVQG